VALALCVVTAVGCDRLKGSPTPTGPDVSGEWTSGGSVYRLTTEGTKVTAVFQTASPDGQALGFKSGDLSFVGTQNGRFIQGEQVVRYPANTPCHRESGRRVPFMAMIAADGKRIVLDWYNVSLNVQTCHDVDRTVTATLLERRGG
jgi:hypothetical protein